MERDSPAGIHPTALVHPAAQLGAGVVVGPYSIIGEDIKIGAETEVGAHVVLEGRVEIGERCKIAHGAIIGAPPQDVKFVPGTRSGVRIGSGNVIREYVTIHRASKADGWTLIGNDNLLLSSSHVAHDCRIGNGVLIINYAGLAGHIEVEDYAVIGGHTGIQPFMRVGRLAYIGGCSGIRQDVPPCVIVDGIPARARAINVIGLRRHSVPPDVRQELRRAFKLLYRSGLSVRRALERIRAEVASSELLDHFVEFVASSTKGICAAEPDDAEP
ncbi:MAG TPA: acyl-ACP--UDP-N-acetylglucosamine O-acyltransferase [Methylomirabilota bacterium]|nr:acyl-ACP--UDP-N-acetylglucosamine O-acyltransferase [Methylomirabilota bacterium]